MKKALDKKYPELYEVSPETLDDSKYLIKPPKDDQGNYTGNPFGKCAEPNCAPAAGRIPGDLIGSATIWNHPKKENPHPYFDPEKHPILNSKYPLLMKPCPTCKLNLPFYR